MNAKEDKPTHREEGLESLDKLTRERLYPWAKEKLTLEDIVINYSWVQLEGAMWSSEYRMTEEEYYEYEDNLGPGYISLREFLFDMNSFYKRQERFVPEGSHEDFYDLMTSDLPIEELIKRQERRRQKNDNSGEK